MCFVVNRTACYVIGWQVSSTVILSWEPWNIILLFCVRTGSTSVFPFSHLIGGWKQAWQWTVMQNVILALSGWSLRRLRQFHLVTVGRDADFCKVRMLNEGRSLVWTDVLQHQRKKHWNTPSLRCKFLLKKNWLLYICWTPAEFTWIFNGCRQPQLNCLCMD